MAAQNQLKKIQERVNTILKDESTPLGRFAAQAEKTTTIPRDRLAAGAAGLIVIWLVFGYGAQLLCNTVGFVYPAYASIKALETHGADDDKKWLTYWVAFSAFSIVEFFADIILSWLSIYWLIKCALLVFLMVPGPYNGSLILYERVLRPFFLKNESKFDKVVNAAENVAKNAAKEVRDAVTDKSD